MARGYDDEARLVLEHLGQGKDKAVSRTYLASLFGGDDRKMRRAIAYAKLKYSVNICNDQDGNGYFIGTTLDELLRQYYQAEARGKKILATLKALRRDIDELRNKDQLSLSDVETELEEEVAG